MKPIPAHSHPIALIQHHPDTLPILIGTFQSMDKAIRFQNLLEDNGHEHLLLITYYGKVEISDMTQPVIEDMPILNQQEHAAMDDKNIFEDEQPVIQSQNPEESETGKMKKVKSKSGTHKK